MAAAEPTPQQLTELTPKQQPASSTVLDLLRPVLVVTAIVCLIELVFQRGLSRMGNSLTMSGVTGPVVDAFFFVDRVTGISLNFAALFLVASLLLLGWQALRERGSWRRLRLTICVGVLALVLFSLWLAASRLLFGGSYAAGRGYQVLAFAMIALVLLYAIVAAVDWRARLIFATMLAAYACSAYNVLGQELLPIGKAGGVDWVYPLGQLFVLAALGMIFGCYILPLGRPDRLAVGLSVGLMLLFAGLLFAPLKVDVPAYIAIFSGGYQFFLPPPIYILVVGVAVYSIAQALRGPAKGWLGSTPLGLGLLLIAIGGYDLKLDIQFMQATLGLLLLTGFIEFEAQWGRQVKQKE